MSNNDGITDDVRKREEEYFRRQDRELIEKMRRASAAAQERMALETQTGIHDPAMLQQLQELWFTPGTIPLLPLIPVLQVAWAEGGISTAERAAIVALARSRGITAGSEADQQLHAWLDQRPSADTFRKATRLIAAMVDHPGRRAAGRDGRRPAEVLRADRARLGRPFRDRRGIGGRALRAAADLRAAEEPL